MGSTLSLSLRQENEKKTMENWESFKTLEPL